MSIKFANFSNGVLSQSEESLAFGAIVVRHEGYWVAVVTAFGNALDEWYFAKERNLHLSGELFAALLAEDIVLVVGQFGGGEVSHVLNETEDRDLDIGIAEQFDTAHYIG